MANETMVNETLVAAQNLPGLDILEPYLGPDLVAQIQAADAITVSIGLIAGAFIVATLALILLKIMTKLIAMRTKTELDDKILEAAQQPIFRLIIVAGVYFAIAKLGIGDTTEFFLRFIISIGYLVVLQFVLNVLDIFVNSGLKKLAEKTDSTFDDEIIPIFHKTATYVIWAFGIILILGVWGVDITPFLAGLGIAGLAISFALQSTLSNIISGISIIMDKVYKVGDKVQLDSGEVGEVYEISLRSTRIKTYDNEILIIPNNNMASAKIKNFTQPDLKIRVVVPFGVEYGNRPEKVIPLIKNAIKKEVKGILKEPEVNVVFTEMSDSSINFKALYWVEHYNDAYAKKIEGTDVIYRTLNKNKIGIPFPTRTIYTKKG